MRTQEPQLHNHPWVPSAKNVGISVFPTVPGMMIQQANLFWYGMVWIRQHCSFQELNVITSRITSKKKNKKFLGSWTMMGTTFPQHSKWFPSAGSDLYMIMWALFWMVAKHEKGMDINWHSFVNNSGKNTSRSNWRWDPNIEQICRRQNQQPHWKLRQMGHVAATTPQNHRLCNMIHVVHL